MKHVATETQTITIHVPMRFSLRGGRKTVILEVSPTVSRPRTDYALLTALAKAHRWRQQIESGEYSSITELAKVNRVNQSYACRLLRLTLLAPAVVDGVLNGQNQTDLTLKHLSRPFPVQWNQQESHFIAACRNQPLLLTWRAPV